MLFLQKSKRLKIKLIFVNRLTVSVFVNLNLLISKYIVTNLISFISRNFRRFLWGSNDFLL